MPLEETCESCGLSVIIEGECKGCGSQCCADCLSSSGYCPTCTDNQLLDIPSDGSEDDEEKTDDSADDGEESCI